MQHVTRWQVAGVHRSKVAFDPSLALTGPLSFKESLDFINQEVREYIFILISKDSTLVRQVIRLILDHLPASTTDSTQRNASAA